MTRHVRYNSGPAKRTAADIEATLAAFERIDATSDTTESYASFDEAIAAGRDEFAAIASVRALQSELTQSEQEQLAYEIANRRFQANGGTDIDVDPRWMFDGIKDDVVRALSLATANYPLKEYDAVAEYVDAFVAATFQRKRLAEVACTPVLNKSTVQAVPTPPKTPREPVASSPRASADQSQAAVLVDLYNLRQQLDKDLNYANLYAAGYDVEQVYAAGFERLGDALDQVNG